MNKPDGNKLLTTNLTPELACSSIEASLHFYIHVLGFRIQYQREEEGFAMLEREGVRVMLDEIKVEGGRSWLTGVMERPFGRGINLEIRTENVDDLYRDVQLNGARVFLPMEEKWYRANEVELGRRQFIVLDPDGYLLRFFQDLGVRDA